MNLPSTLLHIHLGAKIVPSSMFNSILNHVVVLDEVYCIGNEDTLLDCSHSVIGNHLCGQFLQDETSHVAIQCQGARIEEIMYFENVFAFDYR